MITVRPDTRGARAALEQLTQREFPRVVGRSLQRTMLKVKSASSRHLRQRINLKKGDIDRVISTRRSGEVQNLTAITFGYAWFEVRWSGKPVALRDYAAKTNTRGVSFKVSKRGRRKIYERLGVKAFQIPKLGNHVFVRVGPDPKGPGRAPIKKVFGPSIPQFAVTRREMAAIIAEAQVFWADEIVRNSRFAISRRPSF